MKFFIFLIFIHQTLILKTIETAPDLYKDNYDVILYENVYFKGKFNKNISWIVVELRGLFF